MITVEKKGKELIFSETYKTFYSLMKILGGGGFILAGILVLGGTEVEKYLLKALIIIMLGGVLTFQGTTQLINKKKIFFKYNKDTDIISTDIYEFKKSDIKDVSFLEFGFYPKMCRVEIEFKDDYETEEPLQLIPRMLSSKIINIEKFFNNVKIETTKEEEYREITILSKITFTILITLFLIAFTMLILGFK